ncbi:MAG: sulfotransferase family 2 domain-containing protein [Pseudomonadota bacterium]
MSFLKAAYERLLDDETRKRIYKWRHPEHFQRMREQVNPSDKGDFSLKPFDEHQCIFVHITKSAGTSVALALFDHLPYHHTARDYRVIYGKETFNRYFKFAFVRNPWDRLYSAYSYLRGGGWDEYDQAWAEEHLSRFNSFEEFVLTAFSSKWLEKHLHFKTQIDFIGDRHQAPMIDHLMYFETLTTDFNDLAQKLALEARLEHRNPSARAGYREVYTPEMMAVVERVYQDDIRTFGYGFDGIVQRTQVVNGAWTQDD